MTKTGATSNLTLPPASGWLRTMIKALLKRYTYPPDKESAVIELVLQQSLWFDVYLGLTCIDDQGLATGRNQRQISGPIQRRFVGYPPAAKVSFFNQDGR